jgi:hypothetical protein
MSQEQIYPPVFLEDLTPFLFSIAAFSKLVGPKNQPLLQPECVENRQKLHGIYRAFAPAFWTPIINFASFFSVYAELLNFM